MRLTLRTLLAYRDRVLKPAELQDMHARVQQSAMAGNLLKRIESLSNRPTILAPPVDGKGLGADANSIAEYLDDALKGEKVPELERICLESDVQLAELTQCHQLLGSALSTTVDVPAGLRQRIVALGDPAARAKALADRPTGLLPEQSPSAATATASVPQLEGKARFRTDPAHVQPSPAERSAAREGHPVRTAAAAQPVEAPMLASGGESIRPTGLDLEGSHLAHEVPEYLRGRGHDGWRGPLAIGALLAVLALLVWQSLGSWDRVRQMFASRPVDGPANGIAEASSRQGAGAPVPTGKPPASSSTTTSSSSSGEDAAERGGSAGPTARLGSSQTGGAQTGGAQTGGAQTGGALSAGAQVEPGGGNASAIEPPAGNRAEPTGPHAAQWLPADPEAREAILLVQATGGQPLHRMQAAERLPSGTQVFVPPASRPKLELAQGPLWTFCGPTQMAVALPETGAQALPQVDLRMGKALITASALGESGSAQAGQAQSLLINTPDSQVRLTLTEPTTRVAIELSYAPVAYGPMTDRNANSPLLLVSVIDGQARLAVGPANGQAGSPSNVAAGQSVIVSRGAATAPQTASSPAWLDASSDRPVDVLAAADMNRQLTGNEPIGPTLQKLVTNRRPETRALAAETLALLGSWDWLTIDKNTLRDARDRSYWTPLLDLTRQVIAANPDDAKNLRAALISQDAARGPFQAEMWIGLTPAQLEGEGMSKLVDLLNSEVLLDRILAIYQLQHLTGKDLGYQAGEVNRASVQQWNRELASGRIQLLPLGNNPQR